MKNSYPQFPEDWNDPKQTLFRTFKFESTSDIECLIRLVNENISNKGNNGILRARLLGILNSYYCEANAKFWSRLSYPKTYKIRLFWRKITRKYHRYFNTKYFQSNVELCIMVKQ